MHIRQDKSRLCVKRHKRFTGGLCEQTAKT